MRILFMHTKMVSGGIEAMVCGLVNELVQRHDVTLCTIFKPSLDDIFYNKLSSNVKKIHLGKINFGFSIKEIFKIYKTIKLGHFDIVHIHGLFQYYFLAILFLHKKVQFVYTIHSDAKMESQLWDRRLFLLKKYFFRNQYMTPVTISKASKKSFEDLYNCDSFLITNGVLKPRINFQNKSVEQYRFTPSTKVFLHPGRISLAKNQVVLCKVFERLIYERKDVVLLIAGSKEDKTIFEKIEPYLCDRIIFLGEIHDVPDILNQCDGFCLPSLWEGLPIALLEALFVGCIPICSPVGGIVDVLKNDYNGFLSKSPDANDFYNAVISFLESSEETIKIIRDNAIKSFDRFDISTTAGRYEELYFNLLNLKLSKT